MKRIRYIRPTALKSEALQRRKTDHLGPFAITIVHGKDDCTFENALKILKAGNALTIMEFETLGRRIDTRCKHIEAVFDKKALIEDKDGDLHEPSCRKSLIKAIKSKDTSKTEKAPRVPHNKVDQAAKDEAEKLWTGENFAGMKNRQVADETGFSVKTLTEWFGPRSNYIKTRPGRPRRK